MNDPAGRATLLDRIKDIASLVRDIGVIVGVPTVITVGIGLYNIQSKSLEQQIKANEAQIKALESENDVLRQTQYDRALTLLKSQNEIYEAERSKIESEKSDLEKQMKILRVTNQKDVDDLSDKVATLEGKLRETEKNIQQSDSAIAKINASSLLLSSIDVTDFQTTTTMIEELLSKPTLTAAESTVLQALMWLRAERAEENLRQSEVEHERRKQTFKKLFSRDTPPIE